MTSSQLELSHSQPNSSFTPFHPLKCAMVKKRKNQVSPEFAADVKRILCVFCRKKSIWQWQCDVTGCDTDGLPALRVRGIRTVRPSPPDVNRTSNGIGGFRPFSWITRLHHPPVTRPHGSSRKILHPSYRSNSRTMLSSNATAARSRVISRPRVKNVRIKYRTSFFGFFSGSRKISR